MRYLLESGTTSGQTFLWKPRLAGVERTSWGTGILVVTRKSCCFYTSEVEGKIVKFTGVKGRKKSKQCSCAKISTTYMGHGVIEAIVQPGLFTRIKGICQNKGWAHCMFAHCLLCVSYPCLSSFFFPLPRGNPGLVKFCRTGGLKNSRVPVLSFCALACYADRSPGEICCL